MSKVYAFIEFLITVVLRCTANARSILNRFRVWRWLNEPMSESCAPIVRWWNAKAELANSDRNRYFMSARRRYGIFGYGLYTQYQPIILTDEYNTEIEELMKFRYKHESSFFMGGRFEVMAYIKGLRNSDFDNAITMDEFRAARFTAYIDAFCADTMNHQSLFRHWLSTQVKRGAIVSIDGYIFTGIEKNCEIGAFLYKYFDTFETAHAVGLHQGYRSPEHLAQYLIKELQKAALGLIDNFEFECINTKLRDYTERNKASLIAVTDLGNAIEANVVRSLSSTSYEDDYIGVKPATPWPRKPGYASADFGITDAISKSNHAKFARLVTKSSPSKHIGESEARLLAGAIYPEALMIADEALDPMREVVNGLNNDHAETNAEVPSMCDRRVTDIKVNLGESVIHAELPAPLDNLSLMDSTLNITLTTKSLIALDKPFDFTDVLGIFLNGDEVDISKSTSIAESLKVAGITFTDNDRYLHYTPVTKHVDSMVLQLKKSSDVKQKTQAEFTVVAKLPPVIKEILDLPTTEVLHAPVCTIGEAEGIMAMGVVSPESLAANEALDPMSDLSTVIKLLDPLTENTIIDEVVNHDADPATLYPAWGISPLKSNSNEFIEEKFVNVGITSTEVVHDPLKAGLRLDVDNAINFTTPKTWVELIANVLSIRTDDSFYLSPSIMQLKNKGLVLSKDGLQLSFIKLAHCRHDAVIINLMSDKDNVKTSHESLVDIQSLTRSASVASGRLDAKELSR